MTTAWQVFLLFIVRITTAKNLSNTYIYYLVTVQISYTESYAEKLCQLKMSPVIAVMGDESTDLHMRSELSVCFRYLTSAADPAELFYQLAPLTGTDATRITGVILKILADAEIPMDRIHWLAFDGAANMSGRKTGVQAQLKKTLENVLFITFIVGVTC